MKQLTAAILIALSAAVAACGGDDGNDEPAGTPAAETTEAQPTTPTGTEPEQPAQPSAEDEEAVKETVVKWTFEGDCDHMTDKFLEEQLLGLGDTRAEKCELFEKQHQKPQYGEDDMKISDVNVTGAKATLIVSSDIAPDIRSRYSLVKTGDQWQIDAADIQ